MSWLLLLLRLVFFSVAQALVLAKEVSAVISRRTLHEATSVNETESKETARADTDLEDTFFGWFVVVGIAWCIYHACKPGGCCRATPASLHEAPPQPPIAPVGTQNQLAIGMPATHWTPAVDPRIGVAVGQVHMGHQYERPRILHAAGQPGSHIPRVPTVTPSHLYRVGLDRWTAAPVSQPVVAETSSEGKADPSAGHESSAGNAEGSKGTDQFHSAESAGDYSSVYLPPPIHQVPSSNLCSDDANATVPSAAQTTTDIVAMASSGDQQPLQTQQQRGQQVSGQHSAALSAIGDGSTAGLGSDECVICYDGIGDHVMLPCGHGGFCGKCAVDLCSGRSAQPRTEGGSVCPVCRAQIDSVVKVSLGTSIGERSCAECALVVDRSAPEPPQPSNNAVAMHRAMMHFARVRPLSAVHPSHVLLYTRHAPASNPSNMHH